MKKDEAKSNRIPKQTLLLRKACVRRVARHVHMNEREEGDSCTPPPSAPSPSRLPSMAMALLPAGPPTAPNNNWQLAPRSEDGRDTDTERVVGGLWASSPFPLPLPSYSLSSSFYRVPNYVWLERPRAKISRRTAAAVFCRFQLASQFGAMASSRGKKGRKGGQTEDGNAAPACACLLTVPAEPNWTKT